MAQTSDLVGVGAIALVGYFLIKKINDIGTGAVNTATTYIEKVTEKVSDVKEIVHQSTDSVKSYIPGTTTDSDKEYQMYKDTVNSVAAGVDAVSGVDTSNVSRYLYNAGGGYTDQKTGAYIPGAVNNPAFDSESFSKSSGSNKYSSAAGNDKVAGSSGSSKVYTPYTPYVPPAIDYLRGGVPAIRYSGPSSSSGSSKVTVQPSSSSGSSKTTTVKASSGGYSIARESGTTLNKGKYATIKVRR